MSEKPKLPTRSELQQLCGRAIAAYAVRCARRVQPLYGSLEQHLRAPLDNALVMAEAFVESEAPADDFDAVLRAILESTRKSLQVFRHYVPHHARAASNAARAASNAARVVVDVRAAAGRAAVGRAGRAAQYARVAVAHGIRLVDAGATRAPLYAAEDVVRAAHQDYKELRVLSTVCAPQSGDPIDFRKLGPLWPKGEPEWFTKGRAEAVAESAGGGLPLLSDLEVLSPRAIVAYAVRCAKRVQPLYSSLQQGLRELLDNAVSIADAFARGESLAANVDFRVGLVAAGYDAGADATYAARAAADAAATYAARAAADAADATAAAATYGPQPWSAALAAYAAAANAHAAAQAPETAARAAGYVYVATRRDYLLLRALGTPEGRGRLGDPIDFEQLGPLWTEGEPEWFRRREGKTKEQALPGRVHLSAYVDESAPADEVVQRLAEFCRALSAYHVACGGSGLVLDDSEIDVAEPESAEVL